MKTRRITLIIPVSKMAVVNANMYKIFDNPDVDEDKTFQPTHSADGLEPATHCVATLVLKPAEWKRGKTRFQAISGAYAYRDRRLGKEDYFKKSKGRIRQKIKDRGLKPIIVVEVI